MSPIAHNTSDHNAESAWSQSFSRKILEDCGTAVVKCGADATYEVMDLARKIEFLISRDGLTQSHVARTVGADPARVSEWTNGKGKPSLRQALTLSRLFRVPLAYLADDEATDPTPEVTDDERFVLDVLRALAIPRDEAIRRLATGTAAATTGTFHPVAVQRRDRNEDATSTPRKR